MSFNKTSLLKGGNINVFRLTGTHNYLLVLAFTNKGLVVPLINTGRGYTTYIDNTYSEEEYENIEDLMKDGFRTYYKGLPDFSHCIFKKAPTHDKVVVSFIQGKGNKAKDEVLEKILTDAGYDITALKKNITVVSKNRDYSTLKKDTEAKIVFDENAKIVLTLGATISSSSVGAQGLYNTILQGKEDGAIFVGPAGTGKSILARVMAHEMGAPLLTYQATSGMVIEDMKGQFIPSKTPGVQFEYCIGLLLKAYTKGYQMLIDEINMAPADVISLLNQFMDDTPSITINDVVYKRNPNFVLYLTMNAGYEGTYTLNPALKSRFPVLVVGRLTEAVFVGRMTGYAKMVCGNALNPDFFKKLFQFGNFIAAFAKEYGENVEICIRNAQTLTSLILAKQCNPEEFEEAIFTSYVNYLSLDNDNYDKLEALKKSQEMHDNILNLYALYDYREIESVDITSDYESTLDVSASAVGEKRAVKDFDEDELEILKDIGGDEELNDLLTEETAHAPAVESAEEGTEPEPTKEE
jgi:hypothetical protein